MNKYFAVLALLLLAPSMMYEIHIHSGETDMIHSVIQTVAQSTEQSAQPTHEIQVRDSAGDLLIQRNLMIPSARTECDLEGLCQEVLGVSSLVYVPYQSRGAVLSIQNLQTNVAVEQSMVHLSNYCGNGICNPPDDALTCPEDCLLQATTSEQADSHTLLWGALIGLILFLLVLLVIKFRKKPAAPQYVSEY